MGNITALRIGQARNRQSERPGSDSIPFFSPSGFSIAIAVAATTNKQVLMSTLNTNANQTINKIMLKVPANVWFQIDEALSGIPSADDLDGDSGVELSAGDWLNLDVTDITSLNFYGAEAVVLSGWCWSE